MRKFWAQTKTRMVSPPSMPTTNSIPWQRITLSLTGIVIIMFMWRWATFHLYSLPPTSITAFTSITTNSLYVIGALVIFFTTGRLIYEWKNATVSNIIQEAQNITEEKTERVIKPKYVDGNDIP